MNGSKTPAHSPTNESALSSARDTLHTLNDHSLTKDDHNIIVKSDVARDHGPDQISGDEEAESEAETLIDSPVKRREAERIAKAKADRPTAHRIGGLPVPADGDDEMDSIASPVPSTEINNSKTKLAATIKAEDADAMDADGDEDETGSDQLSTPGSSSSRETSVSRATSEQPDRSIVLNPRKRKNRASSVGPPSKRQDVDAGSRNSHGPMTARAASRIGKSSSPNLRNHHRRAVSTQSALIDARRDAASRKRRSVTHATSRESKSSKNANWEESDGSSEATSHGHGDGKMPRRGIGRSTSIPGRPGREHKRRVNKWGLTKLAEGCEVGDLDQVKLWREKDPEQMEIAEFAGNKPLQIAALAGNIEVVDYLIEQGCQIDCANSEKDTPLIDAAENGHLDVVKSLLNAGVDPLRQNLKGRTALDVVKDDTDDVDQIRALLRQSIEKWNSTGARQKREEEEQQRHRAGPTQELHFMARTYENLLHLVQNNDRNGVKEFLDARVPVDNGIIAAAAKTGDSYLVNMLLLEIPEKKRFSKAEKPMLAVIGSSHFDMVKVLTELDGFNPLWQSRRGQTWIEIAEQRNGPMVKEEKELLQKLYDDARQQERQSSSPVSRRDGGKRRQVSVGSNEDSEDDVTPRRVGKRRLMSRRDIRANGRTKSEDESDDDETSSEDAIGAQPTKSRPSSMAAPGSPSSYRIQRRKSVSIQAPADETKARRRSSSSRMDISTSAVGADVDIKIPTQAQTIPVKKENSATNNAGQSEAQNTANEAATAARRLADESAAKASAEAEKRAAEQLRQQQQAREAEERAAEEARREEEMKREEERLRQARLEEERRAQAKRLHQEAVLSGLPDQIAHALNPESDFDYGDRAAAELLVHHCTPIQVIHGAPKEPANLWVLNVQVAPLLGPVGLELMLHEDQPGFAGSLAESWASRVVAPEDYAITDPLLRCLRQLHPRHYSLTSEHSFKQMIQNGEQLLHAEDLALKKIQQRSAVLRYVRLDQVLENLCPAVREVELSVQFEYFQRPKGVGPNGQMPPRPRSRRYKGPQRAGDIDSPVLHGTTKAITIHQK